MKYKVTLNGKTYEVEVEHGKAVLLDEYEALAPAPAAAAAPAAAKAALENVKKDVEANPLAVTPAEAPKAPGSAGHVKLFDVPDKEAAMIMAIVADKMQKPLNELHFISIKEVK